MSDTFETLEAQAIAGLETAAAEGDARAAFALGERSATGDGVPQDFATGRTWYARAAELGHPRAMLALAQCLGRGEGGPVDHDAAMRWYRQAAEAGEPEAQASMALMLPIDDPASQDWIHAALAQHHVPAAIQAMHWLAPEALARAEPWLLAAVEAGNGEAAAPLGRAYASRADWEAAFVWYSVAAAQAEFYAPEADAARAQLAPAALARASERLPRQLAQLGARQRAEAEQLARRAEAGSGRAAYELGRRYLEPPIGLVQDQATAIAWLERAVALGHAEAAHALGTIYEDEADGLKARECYMLAARRGCPESALAARRIELKFKAELAHDAEAAAMVAAHYWFGSFEPGPDEPGLPLEPAPALDWMQRAARLGHGPSARRLGLYHLQRLVRLMAPELDHDDEALRWFQLAARQGDAEAAFQLGQLHHEGRGTEQSCLAASDWFLQAAEAGHVQACYALGCMHRDDCLGEPDPVASRRWLLLAAEAGDLEAQSALGFAWLDEPDRDVEAARAWLTAAADAGDVPAMRCLAWLYEQDEPFKDAGVALAWWRRAAEAGDATAQVSLAIALKEGQGGPIDEAEAIDWARRAAEAGLEQAELLLGLWLCLEPAAHAEGYKWLARAALRREPAAMSMLQSYHGADDAPAPDPALAAWWAEMAAATGDTARLTELGIYLYIGRDYPRDPARAVQLFLQAAELGDEQAMAILVGLYLRGTQGVPRDWGAAARWMQRLIDEPEPIGSLVVLLMYPVFMSAMLRVELDYWRGRLVRGWRTRHAPPRESPAQLLKRAEALIENDPDAALPLLYQAAAGGAAEAYGWLGSLAGRGPDGEDSPASIAWWREGARRGSRAAMRALTSHLAESPSPDGRIEAYYWLVRRERLGEEVGEDRDWLESLMDEVELELALRRVSEWDEP